MLFRSLEEVAESSKVITKEVTNIAETLETQASEIQQKMCIRDSMMALPGALMTVALVAVLSVFQEKILSVVNMISIGVSVFILYLLFLSLIHICFGLQGNRQPADAVFADQ